MKLLCWILGHDYENVRAEDRTPGDQSGLVYCVEQECARCGQWRAVCGFTLEEP